MASLHGERQVPAARPDLTDPDLFPPVSDKKLAWFATHGTRRTLEPGELLFDQGVRDAPFFVLVDGAVEFFERTPIGDQPYSRVDVRTFLGDIAMFTGEPTIAACVAVEPTEVVELTHAELNRLLLQIPELSEWILGTFMRRREWLVDHGLGALRLVAPRASRRAFQVRDLLERNLLPVRHSTPDEREGGELLDGLGLPRDGAPVLVNGHQVLRNPSPAQVARDLGLRADVDGQRFDLVVLGGGPAGLAAAVYGGSEGLRTIVVEAWAPGGQAGTSTRIENYLGFPSGISGAALTRKATMQARRFDAVLSSFHPATEVAEGFDDLLRVDLDDGQHVLARCVISATGARWRRLECPGHDRLEGAGVYYTATATDVGRCAGEDVVVIGGGNSAGQAAVQLARTARSVRVVVRRGGLEETMSRYLVDRLESAGNVEVVGHAEPVEFHGEDALRAVTLEDRRTGERTTLMCPATFVMIGATPCSEPLRHVVATDTNGFVLCGAPAAAHDGADCRWPQGDREPGFLESSRPGVFVAGDLRSGATQRVAGAVGDGALAVRLAHELLAA